MRDTTERQEVPPCVGEKGRTDDTVELESKSVITIKHSHNTHLATVVSTTKLTN